MRTLAPLFLLTLFLVPAGTLLYAQPQDRLRPPRDVAFEHLTVVEGLPENSVWAVLQDHLGLLWFGTQNGLVKYDGYTFTIYRPDPADPHSPSHAHVSALHEDAAGNLWIGTRGGGLNHFDRAAERFTAYRHDPNDPQSLGHDVVSSILEDEDGLLWLATMGGGLNRFDPATGTFTAYRYDPDDPAGLRDDVVHGLWQDEDGLLWAGTHAGGLHRFDPATETFTVYRHDPAAPMGLSHNDVNTIYQDRDGAFWIGTAGGLNHYDPATDRLTVYRHDPDDPTSLSHDNVMQVLEDRDGVLWVGVGGNDVEGGLHRFDRDRGAFTRYQYDPNNPRSLGGNYVLSLYEDRDGALWVGTWGGGLNRLDPGGSGRFTRFMHDPADSTSLSHNTVAAIYEDEAGALWIATGDRRLNRFDRATQGFRAHRPLGGRVMIKSFVRASTGPGHYWIGTHLQGLHLYDGRADTSVAFTEKDGLPHDTVLGLLEDDQGYVWVSTARGLSRFDPEAKTFRTYDVADVLQGNKLLFTATHKSRTGTLFFGGSNGLIAFHPERVRDNPHAPPVVLTDFKLFTESVPVGEDSPLKAHISVVDEIRLAHWQNDLSFTFAALDYQAPARNRYAFKLDNYDDDWRNAGPGRTATYTNLAPGAYVFRVTGANNDGLWSDEGASVRLVIAPEDRAEASGDGIANGTYREISLHALAGIASDGGVAAVAPPGTPPDDAPTILLVEDNADVRAYVRSHLAPHYHVEEARDGAAGLGRARAHPPDLVISDVMMPAMDGYALCRALKTDPDLNHVPVILLTARAGEESKVEGLETGADDYIYKPFSADELLARAENLIEIRRLLRRRFSREVVAVQPGEIAVTPADQAFLGQVQAVVEAHMGHTHFGAEWLADEVGLSPRQLRRKLKELTNLSTAGYIRSMRLQRAARLLEEQAGNVSEVAYAVGFQDPKHFSRLFRQVFGIAPSQVQAADSG